jgi:hypothetical protein
MKKESAFLLLILLLGCAGSKPHGEVAELQTWVGVWRGVAIIENTTESPDEWKLRLTQKNGRLYGRISSAQGQFTRVKIENLVLKEDELSFTFDFETHRGLHAAMRHTAVREGHKLLSLFEGREGGRAFRGRWEARYEP